MLIMTRVVMKHKFFFLASNLCQKVQEREVFSLFDHHRIIELWNGLCWKGQHNWQLNTRQMLAHPSPSSRWDGEEKWTKEETHELR